MPSPTRQEVATMLYGKNVVLRTIKEADFDTLFQYLNDVRNRGEFEHIDLVSEAQMRKKFAETGFWEPDEGSLHVTDKQDNLLGIVTFFKPFTRPRRLGYEIGFAIDLPENWGKGLMTEALSIFVPYLFATKNIERIQAIVNPSNIGSKRVLEKCSFEFEGVLRNMYLSRGRPTDVHIYSILREESPPLTLAKA
jgi:RimJ/RimL family protein N-acetyltransferase